MSVIDERARDFFAAEPLPRAHPALLSIFAALFDAAAILLLAVLSSLAYHAAIYRAFGMVDNALKLGAMIAVAFIFLKTMRGEYTLSSYTASKRWIGREWAVWAAAFICVLCFSFFAKTSGMFSRGAVAIFFCAGALTLPVVRLGLNRLASTLLRDGGIAARRVFIIGLEPDVFSFHRRLRDEAGGLDVVGSTLLVRGAQNIASEIEFAVAKARALCPDDIILVIPPADQALLQHCVDAFMTLPAALHLAPEPLMARFSAVSVGKLGHISSLQLTQPGQQIVDNWVKRVFDVTASIAGLVTLLPLFALVALLIKLDSPGPVFFRQRRSGFNQQTFRIFKFRTMTTLEDGEVVRQASRDDQRVTRIGSFLRRYSIDELPQLINVLIGDMSIVGPRPHALAHNRTFERKIALYNRRHNVKPGITGWAQVNGLRGETDTDDKMRQRVEHDLYYIDHWSALFDLRICLMTVSSPSTFTNAY